MFGSTIFALLPNVSVGVRWTYGYFIHRRPSHQEEGYTCQHSSTCSGTESADSDGCGRIRWSHCRRRPIVDFPGAVSARSLHQQRTCGVDRSEPIADFTLVERQRATKPRCSSRLDRPRARVCTRSSRVGGRCSPHLVAESQLLPRRASTTGRAACGRSRSSTGMSGRRDVGRGSLSAGLPRLPVS